MSEKDAYIKKMEARIDRANAEIETYKAKSKEAGADAEIEYEKTLSDLRSKREAAEAKIDELKSAGEGAFADLKRNLEQIWDDFDVIPRRR